MSNAPSIIDSMRAILPVTRDAFMVMKETFKGDRTMEVELGRLTLQQQLFSEWSGRMWWDEAPRYKSYAKDHLSKARRMLKQVALLTQILTNSAQMEYRFGLSKRGRPKQIEKNIGIFTFDVLSVDILDVFCSRAVSNLTFIQQCRFIVPSQHPELDLMFQLIKECNVNLRELCSPLDIALLSRSHLNVLNKMSHGSLTRISQAANQESNKTDDPEEAEWYHELDLAAQFTNIVKFEKAKPVLQFGPADVHIDPSYELGRYETMALLLNYPVRGENRAVLIEWIRDSGDPERKDDIYDLALMLAAPKPSTSLLAGCYGVLEDPSYRMMGLVLTPPAHIRAGLPTKIRSGTVPDLRMPISLRDLIIRKQLAGGLMDLGVRFKIAQSILDAVRVMHATSWVHGNIRPDSVIFFPARERSHDGTWGPSLSSPQVYAIDQPLIVGFHHSDSSEPQADFLTNVAYSRFSMRPVTHGNTLDAYQHPDRILEPSIKPTACHDLYSVGCILLEIGCWDPLDTLLEDDNGNSHTNPDEMSGNLYAFAQDIDGLMGSLYGSVVRQLIELYKVRRDFDTSMLATKAAATLSVCLS